MKTYLGDSVYAEWDGDALVIYLDNGLGPYSPIVLEFEVIGNLLNFIATVAKEEAEKKPS